MRAETEEDWSRYPLERPSGWEARFRTLKNNWSQGIWRQHGGHDRKECTLRDCSSNSSTWVSELKKVHKQDKTCCTKEKAPGTQVKRLVSAHNIYNRDESPRRKRKHCGENCEPQLAVEKQEHKSLNNFKPYKKQEYSSDIGCKPERADEQHDFTNHCRKLQQHSGLCRETCVQLTQSCSYNKREKVDYDDKLHREGAKCQRIIEDPAFSHTYSFHNVNICTRRHDHLVLGPKQNTENCERHGSKSNLLFKISCKPRQDDSRIWLCKITSDRKYKHQIRKKKHCKHCHHYIPDTLINISIQHPEISSDDSASQKCHVRSSKINLIKEANSSEYNIELISEGGIRVEIKDLRKEVQKLQERDKEKTYLHYKTPRVTKSTYSVRQGGSTEHKYICSSRKIVHERRESLDNKSEIIMEDEEEQTRDLSIKKLQEIEERKRIHHKQVKSSCQSVNSTGTSVGYSDSAKCKCNVCSSKRSAHEEMKHSRMNGEVPSLRKETGELEMLEHPPNTSAELNSSCANIYPPGDQENEFIESSPQSKCTCAAKCKVKSTDEDSITAECSNNRTLKTFEEMDKIPLIEVDSSRNGHHKSSLESNEDANRSVKADERHNIEVENDQNASRGSLGSNENANIGQVVEKHIIQFEKDGHFLGSDAEVSKRSMSDPLTINEKVMCCSGARDQQEVIQKFFVKL